MVFRTAEDGAIVSRSLEEVQEKMFGESNFRHHKTLHNCELDGKQRECDFNIAAFPKAEFKSHATSHTNVGHKRRTNVTHK